MPEESKSSSSSSSSSSESNADSGSSKKKSFQEGYVPSKRSYQPQGEDEAPSPPKGGTGKVRPNQGQQETDSGATTSNADGSSDSGS